MSLYFNWSCDFQRFTKSKKLSKFQVRTTTLFISNKILSTSLFNLQGAIYWKRDFSELFEVLNLSFAAYLLYQMKFHLSRTFFKTFFEVFEVILSKLKLFWPPSLSKQFIYYIKPKPVCQELFSFFSSRFSARPPRLSATALLEYHNPPPPVNKNFQVFSYFVSPPHVQAFPAYDSSPTRTLSPFADRVP